MSKKIDKILAIELGNNIRNIEECNWIDNHFYADYMAQTFYYVKHSTRLLGLAASRLNFEHEQKNHLRFISHLKEGSNHEKLALNDIDHLGFSLNDFPELNSTRLFYEPQYYKIEHGRPLALMGYILFIKALAQKVSPSLTKIISEFHGNKTASFFHFYSSEEDPEHVDDMMNLIRSLDGENLALIEANFSQSAYAYANMVNELKAKWKKSIYRKSA